MYRLACLLFIFILSSSWFSPRKDKWSRRKGPVLKCWKNSSEKIVLYNDATCFFGVSKKKVKVQRRRKNENIIPEEIFLNNPRYKYDRSGRYSYRIYNDTLAITFEIDTADPRNDQVNYYKMKRHKLIFLKEISSTYYANEKRKLRRR